MNQMRLILLIQRHNECRRRLFLIAEFESNTMPFQKAFHLEMNCFIIIPQFNSLAIDNYREYHALGIEPSLHWVMGYKTNEDGRHNIN